MLVPQEAQLPQTIPQQMSTVPCTQKEANSLPGSVLILPPFPTPHLSMADLGNSALSIPGTCTPSPSVKGILLPPLLKPSYPPEEILLGPCREAGDISHRMNRAMSYSQPDPYYQPYLWLLPVGPHSFSKLHLKKNIEILAPITIFGQTPLLRTSGHCQSGLLHSLTETAFLLLICFYPTICTSIKHPKLSASIFGLLVYFSF